MTASRRLPFELQAVAAGETRARATRFETLHGAVETPIFMPVGTVATVRAQHPDTLRAVGAKVLLANTYHLALRPGVEVFEKFGGIHRFMNWERAVLTDSGGFQIFCLENARQITDEGARFRSYIDGKTVMLSPEKSIEIQRAIGSDIMMVLDECVPSMCERSRAEAALARTTAWARRSFAARGDSPQALFGIIQGARFPDLRSRSAEEITAIDFDGFAIGGLAVGEELAVRNDMIEHTTALMPADRPRYLMGVGTPIDLLEAVHRGVDMFDCILPTAFAQQGVAFTSRGKIELRRGVHKLSGEPLDPACACETCTRYTRAYLHHLIRSKEVLGWQLVGIHNLNFYFELMRELRAAIFENRFLDVYRARKPILEASDLDHPVSPPRRRKPKREPILALGDYEIVVSSANAWNIRQRSTGEVMHAQNAPLDEANRLYIEQARLAERLARHRESGEPFVVWDVGLGAAANAMAFVHAIEQLDRHDVPVRLVSFENDLDSFSLALEHPHRFAYLKHPAPWALRETGMYVSPTHDFEWTLARGDFLAEWKRAAPPHLVFFDPFSYKSDGALWSTECFAALADAWRGRDVTLITYSASTGVRERLLCAGFYVFRGVATPPKAETTLATTERGAAWLDPSTRLGREWLQRYERSGARTPELMPTLLAHPQFARASAPVKA